MQANYAIGFSDGSVILHVAKSFTACHFRDFYMLAQQPGSRSGCCFHVIALRSLHYFVIHSCGVQRFSSAELLQSACIGWYHFRGQHVTPCRQPHLC